jgi:HAD superfamily hydrolase (TIGR01549 family)
VQGVSQALIIDVDGTLVDSNYHHVLAWQRALRANGFEAEAWKVHRYVGKGGDKMVASVAGEEAERERGDDIRQAEAELFTDLIGEVRAFRDASSFVRDVADAGFGVILASSAKEREVEHYLDLLEVRDVIDGYTSSADVDQTKPHPSLIEAAREKCSGSDALMIGDSIWDVEAAKRAGLECLAVLTGGFSSHELSAAGASRVQPGLGDLLEHLPEA